MAKGSKHSCLKNLVVALSQVNSGGKINFAWISFKDILVSNLPWIKILLQAEIGDIEKNSLSLQRCILTACCLFHIEIINCMNSCAVHLKRFGKLNFKDKIH